MSEVPCASRAADSAPSLVHGNSPRRHTLRSRSRLLGLERFPNHRVLRRRDGTEQNRHRFFAPKFGRNKKEQLRGPARRNFPSVGRDRPARRANANNAQLSRRHVPEIDDLLHQMRSTCRSPHPTCPECADDRCFSWGQRSPAASCKWFPSFAGKQSCAKTSEARARFQLFTFDASSIMISVETTERCHDLAQS